MDNIKNVDKQLIPDGIMGVYNLAQSEVERKNNNIDKGVTSPRIFDVTTLQLQQPNAFSLYRFEYPTDYFLIHYAGDVGGGVLSVNYGETYTLEKAFILSSLGGFLKIPALNPSLYVRCGGGSTSIVFLTIVACNGFDVQYMR